MKSKLLFLFILLTSTVIFSQDIIISFEGKDEVTSNKLSIDKIVVDNLTTGKSITASNDVNLNLSTVLSNESFNLIDVNKGISKLYPNPVTQDASIEFYSEGSSKSSLIVYDIQGKEIIKLERVFKKGNHTVKFEPHKNGFFFIKLFDAGKSYFSKILSTSNQFSEARLIYEDNKVLSDKNNKKSSVSNFFTEGDVLRYTGTSGDLKATIYDSPVASKTQIFNFNETFYQFEKYLVESEYPSFVNIMFSVTDQNNKGVDYLENEDFEVLENDSKISPSESFRYVKKLNQVSSKQKTVIMLDKSFSIRNNLATIKTAALSLINQIAENQEIAIYTFSETPILLADFTSDKTILAAAVNSIEVDFPTTNLYGSIITGLSKIKNSYSLDGIEEGFLIALTDGDDTQASSTLEQVIAARGNKRVFMVGLGEDLNEDNLNQIAFPGNYINAKNVDELEEKFDQVRLDMLRFSNSFYWLNYMSPKRSNSHSLTVKADSNTNTNSDNEIKENFSANGFVSVLSGVYANVKQGSPYGLDKIEVTYNGVNNLASVDLKATTYWASGVPIYEWFVDNSDNFEIVVNAKDNSKAKLNFKTNGYSVDNKLTIKDTENDYEKVINVNVLTEKPSLDVSVIDIEARKGTFKAEITYNGTSQVNKNGFLLFYGDNPNPTEDILLPNVNTSRFLHEDKLFPGQKYRVKAYSENNQGRGYSKEIEFTTETDVPYFGESSVAANALNANSFKASIAISDYGGLEIAEKGFVWSVNPKPTIEDNKLVDVSSQGAQVNADFNNLSPLSKYYVKAYAINDKGIGYSNETEIITTDGIIPNEILSIESDVTDIQASRAKVKAAIQNTYEVITERGFVWEEKAITTLPTINNSSIKVSLDSESSKNFEGIISILKPFTEYSVRSYLKTNYGITYSKNSTSFKTENQGVTFKTIALHKLLNESVTSGIEIIKNTGNTHFEFIGVCWVEVSDSNLSNRTKYYPTLDNEHVKISYDDNNLNEVGENVFNIKELKPGTIYQLRSFFNNGFVTQYDSNVYLFKTYSEELISDIDGNVYPTVTIGNQTWMADNLRTTKYSNGSEINNQTGVRNNVHPNSYATISDKKSDIDKYGLLYNGEVLINTSQKGPCPEGWKTPSREDYQTLFSLPINGFRYAYNVVFQGYGAFNHANILANLNNNFRAVPSGYGGSYYNNYLNERALFLTNTGSSSVSNAFYAYLFDRLEPKIEEISVQKNGVYGSCRCIKE